jgi:glc operon protein GlcG
MITKMLLSGVALALAAGLTSAQERPPYGPAVTLEQAKKIAAGAIEESRKQNWRMAVAIVDNHGFLKYFESMDDTQTASIGIAVDKAKTAAMYRRPSKAFEDLVNKGNVRLMSLPGAMPIEGGMPIMVGGRVIGAIGVSGMTSEQDGLAAAAGLKVLQ